MLYRTIASFVLCVGAVALGQDQPSATTQKSKSASSEVKTAVKKFYKALSQGDADAVKAAATGDKHQLKLIDAMCSFVISGNKLRDSAVAKFGDAGKGIVNETDPADIAKKLKSAKVKITGDTAVVTPPADKSSSPSNSGAAASPAAAGDEPMTLKNINGQWKVDLSSEGGFTGMAAGTDPAKAVAMMNAMGKAFSDTADEIKAGMYKTLDDAKQAMGAKMMGVLLGGANPSQTPAGK